ncbi:Casein kinase 1-like protein HD16 [Camellia lanceoleosa]|uniref:Casein kinase 1-like protein HD16 n=1 Tax=Camellia lanceoleosa TaxID=1840588 RepID=A0ACC0IQ54_9ERIC|nr:Casein kinase 1-like protein HD16 [Camellia lanceoleosa]
MLHAHHYQPTGLVLVVELYFLYPREGIHRRWENGFRITSMAATADQAAFMLSVPKRKMMDETQETLRTSAFPSTHVKISRGLTSDQKKIQASHVKSFINASVEWKNKREKEKELPTKHVNCEQS